VALEQQQLVPQMANTALETACFHAALQTLLLALAEPTSQNLTMTKSYVSASLLALKAYVTTPESKVAGTI